MSTTGCQDSYPTPAGRHRREIEVRRSRFIATIEYASSREEAKAAIEHARTEFPDARHHCWAYIAGPPGDPYNTDQSDDGEPKGTAGKPILNVLQHSGLGRTVVVVTRYFGGIKLGAGGLVRAYGQAVNAALAELPVRQYHVVAVVRVTMPYSMLDSFVHWLATTDMRVEDRQFTEDVTLIVNVPRSRVRDGMSEIEGFGQGKVTVAEL